MRQPRIKILRLIKYCYLMQVRAINKQERAERLGLLVCEICKRTSEELYVCPSCDRCDDPACNGGCIFCRSLEKAPERCSYCGEVIKN